MMGFLTLNFLEILQRLGAIFVLFIVSSFLAYAHNGEKHEDQGVTVDPGKVVNAPVSPLPVNLGGPFELIDHFGETVTDQSYAGEFMLVFFGYTDCQVMCSISLTRIGSTLSLLQEKPDLFDKLNPLVVTVDPENDTPAVLRTGLDKYHPALIGLTGSSEQLSSMYQAYKQKPMPLEEKMGDSQIISHSSYFYLMGPDGGLKTFFPPILNPESMVAILEKYLTQQG